MAVAGTLTMRLAHTGCRFALCVCLAGCSGGGAGERDASDGAIDDGDAQIDGIGDQADIGVDAADDGVDAGDEGGTDTGDGGEGDDSPSEFWSWCPQAAEYVGGDWPLTLRVTPEALYCGTFDESRTLDQELAAKCRMRLIAGDYPLPLSNGTYPFRLPVCFEYLEPGAQPVLSGVGEILANHDADDQVYRFQISQPFRTAGGEAWVWQVSLQAHGSDGTLVVDGSWEDPFAEAAYFFPMLCLTDCMQWLDVRRFDSCRFDAAILQRHTVEFSGGRIELYLRMGWSPASTEPAIFQRATGTLDGTDFEQLDYYRLIYNPTHHHFTRTFAVLFGAPIGGACGVLAAGLVPWDGPSTPRIATIDCELGEIEERAVVQESFEVLP